MRRLLHPIRVATVLMSAVLASVLPAGTASAAPPGKKMRSPAAAYTQAIKQLSEEARESQKNQKLARQSADFAASFPDSLPPEFVGQKMLEASDDDPFVDAYIRWQLTSFKPTLAARLNDHQFEKFLDGLPDMVKNPRAARDVIDSLQAASRAGALSAQRASRINADLNDLANRASAADGLNQPATQLRTWLRTQLPKTGRRALQCGLENCTALIDAGWPSDDAKRSLDELFESSQRDRDFTVEDRKAVVEQLRTLKTRKNLYVSSASIRDNTVYAEYADTGIYDFDIARWTKMISQ